MVFTMRRLLAIRWSVEEYFKKHAGDYDQPLEISHWEALSRIKSVLEWPMGATLKLESEKVVTVGSTLKSLHEAARLVARDRPRTRGGI